MLLYIQSRYIQSEIEPLVLVLSRQIFQKGDSIINAADPSDDMGSGGAASILHLKATLIALPKNDFDNKKPGESVHVRPLVTAGDLMLALFELMDPNLFKRGVIQMYGGLSSRDTCFSSQVNIFRCVTNIKKGNKWYYLRPK